MIERRRLLILLAAAGARVLGAPAAAHAQLTADKVLADMQLSDADKQKVLAGEFVTTEVKSVSDRDLSFAIAFLVKATPEALGKEALSGDLVTSDAQVQTWGEIKGAGSLADFAKLKITADEAKALSAAAPGQALNLSTAEIAALKGAKGPEPVLAELKKLLLARYQSYKASGLAGIPAYDRGGSSTDHAADLRRATEASAGLKKHLPAFHAMLLGYPKTTAPRAQETFFWVKSIIEKKATYILTHLVGAPDGTAYALARRQFYASTNYNGEQSVAGFLPVSQGSVVVVASHAFTDQVAGFGGSMKRSIGSGIMAKKMKEIFAAGRAKVAS